MAAISRFSALALALTSICAAVEKRDLKAIDSSYDYIVVGGGVSGLVVANRLTEDSNSALLRGERTLSLALQLTYVPQRPFL